MADGIYNIKFKVLYVPCSKVQHNTFEGSLSFTRHAKGFRIVDCPIPFPMQMMTSALSLCQLLVSLTLVGFFKGMHTKAPHPVTPRLARWSLCGVFALQ